LELLDRQRERLELKSPLDGHVLTWEVGALLGARPVEHGQVLLTVADLSATWQLEIDVPDDLIGFVLRARRESEAELPVRFRLAGDRGRPREGRLVRLAGLADVRGGAEPARPTVRVIVVPEKREFTDDERSELRPGISVDAQIHCGRRSVGYVWLHDAWHQVVRWVTF
jgi:hypothetical protein